MAKVEINTKTENERNRWEGMIEEKVGNIETKLDKVSKDLCDFIENADKKYASKTVEKVVYGGAGAVLLAVLYYILNHVGIK